MFAMFYFLMFNMVFAMFYSVWYCENFVFVGIFIEIHILFMNENVLFLDDERTGNEPEHRYGVYSSSKVVYWKTPGSAD